jgi:hypothetical protein
MAILIDMAQNVIEALATDDIFLTPACNPLGRLAPVCYPAIPITDIDAIS